MGDNQKKFGIYIQNDITLKSRLIYLLNMDLLN
jgi:hypothetical protein